VDVAGAIVLAPHLTRESDRHCVRARRASGASRPQYHEVEIGRARLPLATLIGYDRIVNSALTVPLFSPARTAVAFST
jgi:hypothetical protein